ncbi:hypothetical protein AMATHDRAFT_65836 [Amanita thiersii Skay4041]|uniref:Uncharacterized protein n=1 Tax=Amanita thiersii Skay4041 TaxID=703135 RepID=A0A2A9NDZ8_9AGAR|nr:hypothetical protein AMATHDRAFT_65836 [Amanita thiersii Skay4041]
MSWVVPARQGNGVISICPRTIIPLRDHELYSLMLTCNEVAHIDRLGIISALSQKLINDRMKPCHVARREIQATYS